MLPVRNDGLVSDGYVGIKVDLPAIGQGIVGMISAVLLLIIGLATIEPVANTASSEGHVLRSGQYNSGRIDIRANRVTRVVGGSGITLCAHATDRLKHEMSMRK